MTDPNPAQMHRYRTRLTFDVLTYEGLSSTELLGVKCAAMFGCPPGRRPASERDE
jgi:hypothetical protein